ncbi:MAG: Rne/Rng family ribonuclease [Candidatus Eiseniibacteriota bacterium]|nr:MAG: Rne/Rng family ribonuclease [Candidatus Eisenbacteria bacterium]
MKREILINSDPHETRIAILENKALAELLVERSDRRRRVGDIYKGRVNAVLPGMQAAFVDIGLPKTAFLHVSDLVESLVDYDDMDDAPFDEDEDVEREFKQTVKIEDHLEKGQEILVQMTKEAIGTKGPRVSAQVSLPGRYLVLMPGADHVGISRRIDERGERQRLKKLIKSLKPAKAGLIVRTAGEGKSKRHFNSDVRFLTKLWRRIESKASKARAPVLLHRDMELVAGLIRDIFTEDVHRIVIDSKRNHRQILSYVKSFSPELKDRVKLYTGKTPIFDYYGLEAEIEKAMNRKIWLKKGGYITVDQTEALVAIDVNTGRYVGRKNQEETALKTNLEAAREIARQLRLRDVGGIIVVDFIDMEEESNRKAVIDEFRARLRKDRARTKAFQISELGLVEMTRQRERPSLLHYFSEECPTCGGVGRVLSLESMSMRMERVLKRASVELGEKKLQLRVSPAVAVFLLEKRGPRLEQLEKRLGIEVDVVDDPSLGREDFKLILRRGHRDVTSQFDV